MKIKGFSALFDKVPPRLRETAYLRIFGFFKIPLLFFISPSVKEIDDRRCVVVVPLTRRTKNHLGSMYFAALAAGADLAGGVMAMGAIQAEEKQTSKRGSLIFKDFKAEFFKRAEGDVHFACEQGQEIREMVKTARESGERQNLPLRIRATVPSKSSTEPVADFILTLSIKFQ